MALHQVIAAKRDDVIIRWKARVGGARSSEAISNLELVDHIPKFLDEIVAALREDAGLPAIGPTPAESNTAAGHGAQRLRLGFSLDAVVREYGALRGAVVATAREDGAELALRELEVIADLIVSGIAAAVSEYTRRRDAELLRQGNEHFAFVAHELRNPLSSATTAFQLLKTKGQLPSDSRSVGALERGLRRASELIDQTLRMTRVASGAELHRQRTTLGALFEDVEVAWSSEAESKGVELRLAIEKDQRLEVDARLVRSAVGNLLGNAVKYTTPGSAVELRGRVENGHAVIEVEDCCGGLAPGKVEEAFAPFVRFDNLQSGFGLGLAIAKQAAVAHGGAIRVQNLPGKGCIFVLELPVAAPIG